MVIEFLSLNDPSRWKYGHRYDFSTPLVLTLMFLRPAPLPISMPIPLCKRKMLVKSAVRYPTICLQIIRRKRLWQRNCSSGGWRYRPRNHGLMLQVLAAVSDKLGFTYHITEKAFGGAGIDAERSSLCLQSTLAAAKEADAIHLAAISVPGTIMLQFVLSKVCSTLRRNLSSMLISVN